MNVHELRNEHIRTMEYYSAVEKELVQAARWVQLGNLRPQKQPGSEGREVPFL